MNTLIDVIARLARAVAGGRRRSALSLRTHLACEDILGVLARPQRRRGARQPQP